MRRPARDVPRLRPWLLPLTLGLVVGALALPALLVPVGSFEHAPAAPRMAGSAGPATPTAVLPPATYRSDPQRASMATPPPPLPLPSVGWITPRGPATENGSSTGQAPEIPNGTAHPQLLATSVLGRAAANLTGMAVAPGGPLLLALRNGTLWALGGLDLSGLWHVQVREPLVAGPTVLASNVYAVGASGRLYGWDLGSHALVENVSLTSPDLGAAPVPYAGDLFVLTQSGLAVVNGTTGALQFVGANASADPTHSLATAGGTLYAQAIGGLDAFTPLGRLWNFTPWIDIHAGATLWSDGLVAVAGPAGNLSGGLTGSPHWEVPLNTGRTPLLAAAASNGRVFATDGRGPLHALNEVSGASLWKSGFNATSPPTVVGDQVYVGANLSSPVGPGVADLSATTGQILWFYGLPKAVNSTIAVADGVLYAVDGSGNVTAFGYDPPLGLYQLPPNRTGAEEGSPIQFTASVFDPAGANETVSWVFSDGKNASEFCASGTYSVTHGFPTPVTAWAAASVSDWEGTLAGPAVRFVTIYPALTSVLRLDRQAGNVPLWVNATVAARGGNGSYIVSLQVQGLEPGWYSLSSFTQTLELTLAGTAYVTAWVNDSTGDTALSLSLPVAVGRAAFPAPLVTLDAPTPGELLVLWSAPPSPGFEAWLVNVSTDGGPSATLATLRGANASSVLLQGIPMDSDLNVTVDRWTTFGSFSTTRAYVTSLAAPILSVGPSSFPGQSLLSWTPSVAIDHFASWTLNETLPGSSTPLVLPTNVTNHTAGATYQFIGPVVPDLTTTTYQLVLTTADGRMAASAPADYTPLVSPPVVQATGEPLGVLVSWNDTGVLVALGDFLNTTVCIAPGAAPLPNPAWVCSYRSGFPLGSVLLSVPRAGPYQVQVVLYAANGFRAPSASVQATALPANQGMVWYAVSVAGVPFWFWALLVLLLALLVVVSLKLYRERTGIPPYTGEVMPWDPLVADLEPRARPKDPETLRVSPKLHRHRESHSHRHPSGEDEGGAEARATRVKIKRAAPLAPASKPSEKREEEGEDEEEEDTPRERTSPKAATEPSVKIDKVGEEPAEQDEEAVLEGELRKLPVVLRHHEGRREEAGEGPEAPSAAPATRRATPKEEPAGEEEGKPTPTPKRPPSRPKPESEEPTL